MQNPDTRMKFIESYVVSLFLKNQYPSLRYHNLFHTSEVVSHARELASHYKLSQDDGFAVIAAAWFHDTGHLLFFMDGHEDISWRIAEECLTPLDIEPEIMAKIKICIMATKANSNPGQMIEKIICDADTYHLGTKSFALTDSLVREEMRLRLHADTSDWNAKTLVFLQQHQFYTDYCRERLSEQKNANVRMMESRLVEQNQQQS